MASISRLSLVKLFELVLVCIIIGLHYHSYNVGLDAYEILITNGTICGYLVILVGLFAGAMMGTPVNRRIDLFFSLVGCAFFIATGAMVIHTVQRTVSTRSSTHDIGLAKGSLCIINGILFLVDAILTFRGEA